jgi:hypothetical protein
VEREGRREAALSADLQERNFVRETSETYIDSEDINTIWVG